MSSIKLKAKAEGETVEVKALITHPMETGLRKDKATGEIIPAHFIQEITVTKADAPLVNVYWGASVSKNPFMSFQYKGAVGDKLKLTWKDNKGETDSAEADVT